MENSKRYETIHRYLLDDMDVIEKAAFEKKIATDEITKKSLEMEKRFLKTIDMAADVDLKNTISTVHKDLKEKGFFENQHKRGATIIHMNDRRYNRTLMAIAALIAILIASWFIFNNSNKSSIDTDRIFANYYKPENQLANNYLIPGYTSLAETPEEKIHIAIDQYIIGEYKLAQEKLSALHREMPENDVVVFYLALTNMGLNDYANAISLLQALSLKDSDLKLAANWYLGLAYLKNKKVENASEIFQKLANSNSEEYRSKATLILDDLK